MSCPDRPLSSCERGGACDRERGRGWRWGREVPEGSASKLGCLLIDQTLRPPLLLPLLCIPPFHTAASADSASMMGVGRWGAGHALLTWDVPPGTVRCSESARWPREGAGVVVLTPRRNGCACRNVAPTNLLCLCPGGLRLGQPDALPARCLAWAGPVTRRCRGCCVSGAGDGRLSADRGPWGQPDRSAGTGRWCDGAPLEDF